MRYDRWTNYKQREPRVEPFPNSKTNGRRLCLLLLLAHSLCLFLCLLIWRHRENCSSSSNSVLPLCTLQLLTHPLVLSIQLKTVSPRKEVIAGGTSVLFYQQTELSNSIERFTRTRTRTHIHTHLPWYINLPPHPHFFFFFSFLLCLSTNLRSHPCLSLLFPSFSLTSLPLFLSFLIPHFH